MKSWEKGKSNYQKEIIGLYVNIMKNRYNPIISLIIAITLVFGCSFTSYAYANSEGAIGGYDKVSDNYGSFSFEDVLAIEMVDDLVIDKQHNKIIYHYTVGEEEGYAIEERKRGYVSLKVTEGGISNELIFSDNGDIYLDGNPVTTDSSKEDNAFAEIEVSDENESNSRGQHYNVANYVLSCPYSTHAYYTYLTRPVIIKNIAFGKAVINVTTSVVITLIVTAITAACNLELVGASLSIGSTLFTSIVQQMKASSPQAIATKFKIYRYQHSSSSAIVPSSVSGETRYVWKDIINYYVDFQNGSEIHLATETKYLVNKIKG